MRRSVYAVVLAAGICSVLAGCGKAGRPQPQPGSVSYQYPSPELRGKSALPPEWDQEDINQAYPNGQPKNGGPTPAKTRYVDQEALKGTPSAVQPIGPRGSVQTNGPDAALSAGASLPGSSSPGYSQQQTPSDSQQ